MLYLVETVTFRLKFKSLVGCLLAARAALENGEAVTITPELKGKK